MGFDDLSIRQQPGLHQPLEPVADAQNQSVSLIDEFVDRIPDQGGFSGRWQCIFLSLQVHQRH